MTTSPDVNLEDNVLDKIEPEQKKSRRIKVKYLIDMGMVVTFSSTFITGLIKQPLVLDLLGESQRTLPMYEISIIHDYGALLMGFLILAHLILNMKWIKNMTVRYARHLKKRKWVTRLGVLFIVLVLLFLVLQTPAIQNLLFGSENTIIIEGVGSYKYDPDKVQTVRPDIFRAGHFSIFDILVNLDNRSKIDMEYHFDASMNTHVIDSINGKSNWWHEAYYDGGWSEDNVFRMDHYPYKDKMYIKLYREDKSRLERIYNVFHDEVARLARNAGKVIIPKVIIEGTNDRMVFNDVEVTPHNLRDDMFQDGVISAIDVIMTLGDQDRISYKLNWYEEIGYAEVKNYYVDKINDDKTYGRCGFVYEEGSNQFSGFTGNHIHIPSDIRVINSPEYEEWFWICI